MIEKTQAGPVWRPTMAPHPIKNLVIEPAAVFMVASTGWIKDDVKYFDSLTVDLVIHTRNMGSRPVKNVTVNAQILFGGHKAKSIVERTGEVEAGYEATTTMEAIHIASSQSKEAKAFLDALNVQDPHAETMVPVTVIADFIAPLGGPLQIAYVANARTVTKSLPLQSRSGSPARMLE